MLASLLAVFPLGAQQMPPLHYAELGTCSLESGKAIEHCRVGYRVFGTLDAAKDNAVLFPVWFTGRSGDVGALIGPGPGHFVDTQKYFVIVVDPFGDGISSSPSNSTAQHGVHFPQFTIRDMVRAEERVVRETLHLDHLHAVVGQSMGAFQTFEWGIDAPTMMDALVPIAGTPQVTSYDMLLWSMEKEAIESDPAYKHGLYTKVPDLHLVSAIHQMNLSTPQFRVDHTTREGFAQWYASLGGEWNNNLDPNNYLWQLNAVLSQDISHNGNLYAAAPKIKAHMLIINGRQDHMVNPIPALAFARLTHSQTVVLEGNCGHMAPGCEIKTVSPAIAKFLEETPVKK